MPLELYNFFTVPRQVWTGGFRRGPPAYSSFFNARVYEWTLGTPTDRIPAGADAGALGMKEKGWRRLIVPAALDSYRSQATRLGDRCSRGGRARLRRHPGRLGYVRRLQHLCLPRPTLDRLGRALGRRRCLYLWA